MPGKFANMPMPGKAEMEPEMEMEENEGMDLASVSDEELMAEIQKRGLGGKGPGPPQHPGV